MTTEKQMIEDEIAFVINSNLIHSKEINADVYKPTDEEINDLYRTGASASEHCVSAAKARRKLVSLNIKAGKLFSNKEEPIVKKFNKKRKKYLNKYPYFELNVIRYLNNNAVDLSNYIFLVNEIENKIKKIEHKQKNKKKELSEFANSRNSNFVINYNKEEINKKLDELKNKSPESYNDLLSYASIKYVVIVAQGITINRNLFNLIAHLKDIKIKN